MLQTTTWITRLSVLYCLHTAFLRLDATAFIFYLHSTVAFKQEQRLFVKGSLSVLKGLSSLATGLRSVVESN